MKKRKNQLILNFNEQNADPENDIDFRWSSVKEEEDEEDITKANFIKSLQMQNDEENFLKK